MRSPLFPTRMFLCVITATGWLFSLSQQPCLADKMTVRTRLFFQDHHTRTVRWADVVETPTGLQLTTVQELADFPKLDVEKQTLVQMKISQDIGVVGVRDNQQGNFQSGWIVFHTGIGGEEHGDHTDWHYAEPPRVWDSHLASNLGNPAHVYVYDDIIYLTQDSIQGFSRVNPAEFFKDQRGNIICGKPGFHVGGGNHISLIVADASVGYSAWIDRGGPNKGRIDVTAIRPLGNDKIAYSFHLPEGGIHGATINRGRAFFAAANGVYWFRTDPSLQQSADTVQVHHLSLGIEEETQEPLRTGAFTNHGKYVLCVTGSGASSKLILFNAELDEPQIIAVPLSVDAGNQPVNPEVVRTREGKRLGFVFHNHPSDVEFDDYLSVIDLDPDGNGDFSDAIEIKKLLVGKSKVEGHNGHHAFTTDADVKYAYFCNPGDGSITVLSLKTLEPLQHFKVGGMPTRLVAYGGKPHHD